MLEITVLKLRGGSAEVGMSALPEGAMAGELLILLPC